MDELEQYEKEDVLDELELGDLKYNSNFLRVLCILTFVGSGLMLFFMIMFYYTTGVLNYFFVNALEQNSFKFILLTILSPILCIAGAVLMINRNRWGYVIYILGAGAPVAMSIILALTASRSYNEAIISSVLRYVFNIAFIIMYGTQLHVMKPWSSKKK